MAKSIYICLRKPIPVSVERRLLEISEKLAPDNIMPAESRILVNRDIAFGIINSTTTLMERGNSLLLGKIFDKNEN